MNRAPPLPSWKMLFIITGVVLTRHLSFINERKEVLFYLIPIFKKIKQGNQDLRRLK